MVDKNDVFVCYTYDSIHFVGTKADCEEFRINDGFDSMKIDKIEDFGDSCYSRGHDDGYDSGYDQGQGE